MNKKAYNSTLSTRSTTQVNNPDRSQYPLCFNTSSQIQCAT